MNEQTRIWWRADLLGQGGISPARPERVSETSLWFDGRRYAKFSRDRYFPTYAEARAALIDFRETRVGKAQRGLDSAEIALRRARELPEEPPETP
jgi:hypothetical protein